MKISKKMAKIMTFVAVLMSVILSLSVLANGVYANGYSIPSAVSTGADGALGNIGGMILMVAQVIGTSVAVIMLIVLAIKYISAAPNDKAEIKKHAVVYIVGAIVLFAASALLGILRSFTNGITAP